MTVEVEALVEVLVQTLMVLLEQVLLPLGVEEEEPMDPLLEHKKILLTLEVEALVEVLVQTLMVLLEQVGVPLGVEEEEPMEPLEEHRKILLTLMEEMVVEEEEVLLVPLAKRGRGDSLILMLEKVLIQREKE